MTFSKNVSVLQLYLVNAPNLVKPNVVLLLYSKSDGWMDGWIGNKMENIATIGHKGHRQK